MTGEQDGPGPPGPRGSRHQDRGSRFEGPTSTVLFVSLFVVFFVSFCLFSCTSLPKRKTKRSPKSYKPAFGSGPGNP